MAIFEKQLFKTVISKEMNNDLLENLTEDEAGQLSDLLDKIR